MKKELVFIWIMLVASYVNAQTPTSSSLPDPNWTSVWQDDFTTMSISSGMIGNWYLSDNAAHSTEPQLFMMNNVSANATDGVTINLKKEELTCTGCPFQNYHYSSGQITRYAAGSSPKFGYMEATIKMSNTYGTWPAFWTWTEEKKAHFACNSSKYYRYNYNDPAGDPANTTTLSPVVDLNGICYTDKWNGYAVGTSSKIYRSTNGGGTWTSQTVGTGTFKAITFTDLNKGFAVGTGSTIYMTSNAGTVWSSVTNSAGVTLNAIAFPNAKNGFNNDDNTGYIAGASGKILKTTNGGTTWPTVTVVSANDLNGIFFLTDDLGFAVGNSGTIVKTTNGGTSWSTLSSGTLVNLNAVYFFDSNNGIIAGNSGVILKTTNGGSSWTTTTLGTANYKSLSFIDKLGFIAGSVVGGSATVYRTSDGGGTWTQITTNLPTTDINCVYFSYDYDEIDIFEMGPGNRFEYCDGTSVILSNTVMTSNSWIGGYGGGACNNSVVGSPSVIPDYTNWLTYAIEWSPSKIIYYVNGSIIKIRPNTGYDPVTNTGGMITQPINIMLGMAASPFVKWNTPASWPAGTCNSNSLGAGIYNPCNVNYADYFISGYNDNNGLYPGYNISNPQYSVNTTGPSSYPYIKIKNVKYYQLDMSTCNSAVVVVNNNTDWTNITSTVKKNISVQNVTTAAPKVVRASEYINLSNDFTSGAGQELYLDVNPCY